MKPLTDHPTGSPALPQLEQLLVRAAGHRAVPRFGRRRWALAIATASLVAVGGAAATTDVFHIAGGQTSDGSYSIEGGPGVSPAVRQELEASICLQLRYNDSGPAYGCGARPSAAQPFGLVIADPLGGARDRVVYGLVADSVESVAVLHPGGSRTVVPAEAKEGLPGRFFSAIVPNSGQIELAGYDSQGKQIAQLGSLTPPAETPDSRQQAMEQGDPAGFAPAIPPSGSFTYKGQAITPVEAANMGLACMESREGVQCFDSVAEAEAG